MSSWCQSSVHMERALLERCPNTLLRRRVSEGLKMHSTISNLALPTPGLHPIAPTSSSPSSPATSAKFPAAVAAATAAAPRYQSLAEILVSDWASPIESVMSPRTPMRNQLVEKGARAYLLPSDSFNKSRLNTPRGVPHLSSSASSSSFTVPWAQSFSRFLPRLSVLTTALNPFHAFQSAFQVFRSYVTGARAIQPAVVGTTRIVSRSFSMPIQRSMA